MALDSKLFMQALHELISRILTRNHDINVKRLADYPGLPGDDCVWYFSHPTSRREVQLDPGIGTLFMISTENEPGTEDVDSLDHAVEVIERRLGLTSPRT